MIYSKFIIFSVQLKQPPFHTIPELEMSWSLNGIDLTNADHREAVRVVKESKGALGIVREGGRSKEGGGGKWEGGRGREK